MLIDPKSKHSLKIIEMILYESILKDFNFISEKIIVDTFEVHKFTQKVFYFLLTLTEIHNGTGVWLDRELISKQGRKGAIGG